MSPDLLVQNIYFLQNYNRYTYVLNNPMSLVDPSGYGFFGGLKDCTMAGLSGAGEGYHGFFTGEVNTAKATLESPGVIAGHGVNLSTSELDRQDFVATAKALPEVLQDPPTHLQILDGVEEAVTTSESLGGVAFGIVEALSGAGAWSKLDKVSDFSRVIRNSKLSGKPDVNPNLPTPNKVNITPDVNTPRPGVGAAKNIPDNAFVRFDPAYISIALYVSQYLQKINLAEAALGSAGRRRHEMPR